MMGEGRLMNNVEYGVVYKGLEVVEYVPLRIIIAKLAGIPSIARARRTLRIM